MPYSFKGGIHPPQNKKRSAFKASAELTPPERLYFPVQMHVGAPCDPLVAKGDPVCIGQCIASSDAPVSAPIYSSVSGTVEDIIPYAHPSGRLVRTIVVKNDYMDTPDPLYLKNMRMAESRPFMDATPEEILSFIKDAGIVGMGGAGFPTGFKLQSVMGKAHTLIINAAECEPYITADNRLLVERSDDVVNGILLLMKCLGLSHATLAIESNKANAIHLLTEKLPGTGILLRVLRTKYPQGSEKHIIRAVTGKEVPSGCLPGDIGCAVMNPASCAAVFDAVAHGMPLMSRFVTVSGSAIVNPQNFRVRIGTPISELIEAAGGFSRDPLSIVVGGPMMGSALYNLDPPVLKTTNSVLAFCDEADEGLLENGEVCMRCGKCTTACPMSLLPVYINLYASRGDYEYCEKKLHVRDCIECGACAYTCPGHIPLAQTIRLVKQKLGPVKKG